MSVTNLHPNLFQLHWQNRNNLKETEMIAQGDASVIGEENVMQWISNVFRAHMKECPKGWIPLVCTWDSEYFVKAIESV